MVNVMRRLRWPSELALLAMGVALICGISTELVAGTGGLLIGIILALLGVGLVILGSAEETHRRRLVGIRISVFTYMGLVLGFVLAMIGLVIAGSSVSAAERAVPGDFGGFVYQVGNGLGGLFILLGLIAAGYTAWAYLTTRHTT